MPALDVARLREVVSYDPDTGVFTRRVRTAQRHKVGDRADFIVTSGNLAGYRRVSIDSRRYLAHRLAWFYVHGKWPEQLIDHRDVDRGNNRIKNLRDVPHRVNQENVRKPRSTSRSGFLGVYLHKPTEQWRARLQVKGRGIHVGLFDTPEAAHQAYLAAKRLHHEGCTL